MRFCSITSPISGIVVQLLARQGQFFNQASPLATVIDLSEVFVHLRIPAAKFSKVRSGTPVDVEVTSFPGRIFRGTVTRIRGEADPLSGDIEAFAVLKNKDALLHPGIGCKAACLVAGNPQRAGCPRGGCRGSFRNSRGDDRKGRAGA